MKILQGTFNSIRRRENAIVACVVDGSRVSDSSSGLHSMATKSRWPSSTALRDNKKHIPLEARQRTKVCNHRNVYEKGGSEGAFKLSSGSCTAGKFSIVFPVKGKTAVHLRRPISGRCVHESKSKKHRATRSSTDPIKKLLCYWRLSVSNARRAIHGR